MKDAKRRRFDAHGASSASKKRTILAASCALLVVLVAAACAGCDTSSYIPPSPGSTSSQPAASTTTTAPMVSTTVPLSTTTVSAATTTSAVSSTTTTSPSTTTTTEVPAVPGAVLYEITRWSAGMEGWAATGQWKTVRGMLVSDGTQDSIAVAPVDLGNQADCAVEAEIQVLDPGRVVCYLQARLINGEGYYGGLQGWVGDMRIGFASDTISSADFSTNSEWHTYRLEVSGNTMTLFFDGAEVARAMDNRQLEAGTVGIYCSGQINVRAFRVIAL